MKKIKKLLIGLALGVLCCFSVTVTATEPSYASSNENPSIQDKIADYMKKVANKYTGWVKSKSEKAKINDSNNQITNQPIYYYMEKGKVIKNCWRTIGGGKYYFESDGKMAYGVRKIGSTYYVFANNTEHYGELLNFYPNNYNVIWRCYSKANGNPYTNITNVWLIDGQTGKAIKNGWVGNISNIEEKLGRVYVENYKPVTQWKKIDGKWYYFNDSFIAVKGLQTINNKTYYFNLYNVMQTGLQPINYARYFFNSNGVMVKSTWKKVNGNWYYFKSNGQAVSGTTMKINGKMYSFRTNGTCINP